MNMPKRMLPTTEAALTAEVFEKPTRRAAFDSEVLVADEVSDDVLEELVATAAMMGAGAPVVTG